MGLSLLQSAYKRCGAVLWVTPCEISTRLWGRNYAQSVRQELSEWIARKMSMTFVAGQREAKPPVIQAADLMRMLDKMGYCEPNAREITAMVMDVLPLLYTKGQSRKNLH